MTLVMKDACEACGAGLVPNGTAFICSFECSFCEPCQVKLEGRCPNCGGELVRRPRRKTEPNYA